MMWQGQTVDGMGSGVHNYTDYGQAWRLFIEDSFNISGSFINDNESGINIQLDPGSYMYSFAGELLGERPRKAALRSSIFTRIQ